MTALSCPFCGADDPEPVSLCSECEAAVATDQAGLCGNCAPEDRPDCDICGVRPATHNVICAGVEADVCDECVDGDDIVRRDQVQPVKPLVQP